MDRKDYHLNKWGRHCGVDVHTSVASLPVIIAFQQNQYYEKLTFTVFESGYMSLKRGCLRDE